MTLLDAAVSWLVQHGPTLLLGATMVLAAGCVALLASRSLEQRRRLGVWTALGTSLYLVLGAVPLPRLSWPESPVHESPRGELAPAAPSPALSPVVDPELRAAALERALVELQLDPTPASAPSTPLPAATEPAAAGTTLAWPALLAGTWLLGASFFLLRHLVGTARLRRLLAACTEADPAAVPGFAMPNGTRLLLSPHRVRPFCTGILRPVIVLPHELLEPDRLAEARAVLAHEASHLRAGDSRVAALLAWLAIPLFCHPLYWWLCREVRFCNELLADDEAAGPDRNSYARALLDLAEHDQPVLASSGTVAVFHRPSEFYRRIQMLLQRRGSLSSRTSRLRRATSAFAALCFVGTVAGLLGMPAAAQEPGDRARKEAQLRETIAALRAEIRDLRSLLQTKQEPDASADQLRDAKTRAEDHRRRVEDASRAALLWGASKEAKPGDSWESTWRVMQGNRFYRVQQGDTLERIALHHLGNESLQEEVRRLNPDVDWDRLTVGQRLYLPRKEFRGPEPGGASDQDAAIRWLGQHQDKSGDAWTPLSGSQRVVDEWVDWARTAKPGGNLPAGAPANATGDLASRYLDLQAETEIAEATAAESKQLAERGLASSLDARKAAVNLRTLQKKFGIVRRLLDGEIDATEAEIDWLSRRIEATDAADRDPIMIQRDRARARLDAMRAVK